MAGGEQREVGVEEVLGERVAHRDPVEEREHAGAPFRRVALPHRRRALLDVDLVERERREPEVDVAAGAERGDDRGVAVVGEGAPVVEGDGDGTAHGGPPRFGGAPATWLCSQRYPTGEVGNQGLSRAGRPAGRSRPARGPGRRRRRRRTRGASACTRGSTPTAAASANHSGVAGPPARSIAAVNADAAWPDGNELVIGPVHAVGERTLGRVVVRRAHPAEARLDRPVGQRRLDAERRAHAQRDRRVAARGPRAAAPTSSQSSPWSAALDKP